MYLNERGSDAPQIYRADIPVSIKFKAKDGSFDLYDRRDKKQSKEKSIKIIPVSDSRFTVKAAQVAEGEMVWSGLYRSPKQHITVLKKKGTKTSVYAEGTWEELKRDPNMKYTKVLYCLIELGGIWVPAQFELQGISSIMWQTISSKGTDRIMKLETSPKKTFKTDKGFFYEMVGGPIEAINPEQDGAAQSFAAEVKKIYDTNDANYEHYKKERGTDPDDGEAVSQPQETKSAVPSQPRVDISEVEIPIVGRSDDDKEIKIEDVPF